MRWPRVQLRYSKPLCQQYAPGPKRTIASSSQRLSDASKDQSSPKDTRKEPSDKTDPSSKTKQSKSVTQEDEELRQKLEQMSGGGGASGIEYEDGKPNTMKRSVRNNMFRYI